MKRISIRSSALAATCSNFNKAFTAKTLILSCLAASSLALLAGCASDETQSTASQSSATTMSTDSKDMVHSNTH